MSLKAITWVMEHAPVESPTEMVILYALADRAHDDGSSAWPSYQGSQTEQCAPGAPSSVRSRRWRNAV